MEFENILFEVSDGVGVITINRPDALNALNSATLDELEGLLASLDRDESVRALLITGAGDKAFVAGADIRELIELDGLAAHALSLMGQRITDRLESMPVPVVAAVNGYALGGGFELALACDFIYASENARLGLPEVNLGIIPGFGGTQRLCRLVGTARALEMCLTGSQLDAEEAYELGIVNRVLPQDKLMEETLKRAEEMALKGRYAVAAIKRLVRAAPDVDLTRGLEMESAAFGLAFSHPDAKEGFSAFLEKRKPKFA